MVSWPTYVDDQDLKPVIHIEKVDNIHVKLPTSVITMSSFILIAPQISSNSKPNPNHTVWPIHLSLKLKNMSEDSPYVPYFCTLLWLFK